MRAQRLRQRVTVEQPVAARDTVGEESVEWQSYCVRWAAVEPITGKELWTAQQETATQQVRVVLRYDNETDAITPRMRINHGGKLYDIESVIDTGTRHREVQLKCVWRQLPEIYP